MRALWVRGGVWGRGVALRQAPSTGGQAGQAGSALQPEHMLEACATVREVSGMESGGGR